MAIDFTVWAGVKLGAGFMIGASLAGLVVWMLVVILVAAGFSALWR